MGSSLRAVRFDAGDCLIVERIQRGLAWKEALKTLKKEVCGAANSAVYFLSALGPRRPADLALQFRVGILSERRSGVALHRPPVDRHFPASAYALTIRPGWPNLQEHQARARM